MRAASFACAAVIALGATIPSALPAAHAQGHVLDELAAIVGGATPARGTDLVLRSDVELRARLALLPRDPVRALGPLPEGLLRASLDEIVGEVLIAREAERLHASPPSDAAIARQRSDLVERAGGADAVERLLGVMGADLSEIDALAERRARVEAFLRANLEGSTVISDARVEEVYASGEHPFADRPLDEVREPLRAWLAAAALERDVARWISVLRGRTTVRLLLET